MTWWQAIVLGVVQGLTEFLPISSTAHLIVVQEWFGLPADGPFTTVVQLGTLVAVFVYFRTDIAHILKAVAADVRAFRFGTTTDSRLAWLIVLGSVPAGLVGLAFGKPIKAYFYDPLSIGVIAIAFSLLMLAAEIWHRTRRDDRHLPELIDADLTWKEAIWVGLWQACALLPGASRSGCTISGALFAGLSRTTAARFSFLLSLPTILAAGLKDLYSGRQELLGSTDQLVNLVIATAVSGVVGYAAVAWFITYLKRASMNAFVAYRIVLGVTLIALSLAGVLRANAVPTPPDSRATVQPSSPPPTADGP
jgi:undecaprenyl-diphosphatase